MRRKCLVSMVLTLVLALAASPARAELVGHWRLDETGGTVAADDSGNGNDGTLQGDPQWVTGQIGGALQFDGVDDYVDCGNDAVFDITEQITLAVWVNANDMLNGQHNPWLGKGDNTYAIKHQSGNYLEFFVFDGSWHSTQYTTELDSLNGEWHHMAGTFDGEELKFYLDGEEAANLAFVGSIGTATHPVTLGNNSQASGRFFDGMLDDARIYDEALAPEEIQTLMRPGPTFQAIGPKPSDGSIVDETAVTLEWRPGDLAASHSVYFGESFDEVDQGLVEPVPTALTSLRTSDIPVYADGLVPGQTYYWRVDEVNDDDADSPWRGDVWSFRVRPVKAWGPMPGDGGQYVHPEQELTWEPTMGALFYTVYFGQTFDEVNEAVAGGTPTTNPTFDPTELAPDTTYYWRVDTFAFPGSVTHKGDVWSFTTVPEVAVTDPDLVGWWTLDEGMGTTAVDWSGHANHGQILGGAEWAFGLHGGALRFDGADDYVDCGNDAAFDITEQITLAVWVNAADMLSGQHDPWLGKGDNAYAIKHNTGNYLEFFIYDGEWHSVQYETDLGSLSGEWHHMAGTFDGQALRFYLDGQEVAILEFAGSIGTAPHSVTLGNNSQASGRFFDGMLDDARIYKKVLTAEDIQAVMRGNPLLAWDPSPAANATVDIRDVSVLGWSAGDGAVSHDVYFGTDGDALELQGNQAGTSFSLSGLVELGGSYFWRIDELDAGGAVQTGYVWTFTIPPYLIVEDFESYDDDIDGGTTIWQTWIDGVENGTGSYVGYETSANGTFGETGIVHGGWQSMPLQYDNTAAPGRSEADRTFTPAQDWTAEGVTTLVIHFRGERDNAGQLYATVNGTKIPYDGDPADIASTRWIAWQIDLAAAGVDSATVSSLTIGVEGGETGTVYVDDIWLTKP